MRTILVVNCGSSTVKCRLFRMANEGPLSIGTWTAERIGMDGGAVDHAAATREHLSRLPGRPDAVGHRVVHGGQEFLAPALIDSRVLSSLEALAPLAPLHNPPALAAIGACRDVWGDEMPIAAVFDTSFHSRLPARAFTYAIPKELAKQRQIRRYGFHGIAHQYLVERYAAVRGTTADSVTAVTLQLGNGCSIAAIEGGRSIDTSMGFTPLEGLVMGTRSGDLDPAIVSYLAGAEGLDSDAVVRLLERDSGLLGISGLTSDMRELLDAAHSGDADAELAVELFCYRARKYLVAYFGVLGGPCPVLFGGGIGENAPEVRRRICTGLEWTGLVLDPARNEAVVGIEGTISSDRSRAPVQVLPVQEEWMIARETARLLGWSESGAVTG